MYTTCPACQTVFRLTAATLRAAHGQVVCATCNSTFDALFGLSDEVPAGMAGNVRTLHPPADDLPANPSLDQVAAALADAGVLLEELDDPTPLDEVTLLHIPGTRSDAVASGPPQVARYIAEDAASASRRGAPSTTSVELDDDAPTGTWAPIPAPPLPVPLTDENTPTADNLAVDLAAEEATTNLQGEPVLAVDDAMGEWMDEAQPQRPLGWAWTLGSVALLLVFAGQAVHHWREPLSRHPTLGPGVVSLYAALGLPFEPPLHVEAYTVTQGRVDAATTVGALRVSAVITNRTNTAQPQPLLQVTLEDRYGAPIGRRVFRPNEYSNAPQAPLLAHGSLPAAVEVADPGNEAVGFKLDVCLEAAGRLHCASDPADGSAAPAP
jgi:predicted Zn finger-like uncharacterized protein